ncbi:ribonuclease III [Patescibacteria group bacterium]
MTDLKIIKDSFSDKSLFDMAMTHRSWVNEHTGVRRSNERLEFLGDAILEYVVSYILYQRFTQKEEGYLTALRASLVNTVSLAAVAKKLKLGSQIHLSKGEEEGGGRENTSLLADTVEALIGAVYLDSGLDGATTFIEKNILNDLSKKAKEPLKDSKSTLQEYVQAKGFSTPRYQVVEESGPDHDKKFVTDVWVGNEVWGRGVGTNKSTSEQEAAKNAIKNYCEKDLK